MTAAIGLRPAGPSDEPFLLRVYASTRIEELAPLGWPPQAQADFLAQQHRAQHGYYHEHDADAEFLVIEAGGAPAGRLYRHRRPDELRLVDIALPRAAR